MNKKKLYTNIALSVLALTFFICGPFLGVFTVEKVNGWLSDGYEYDQIENVTAFYTAPFLEEKSTEARYASVNGTGSSATVTSETPLWDLTTEWDQVTITSTGPDVKVMFNVNMTTKELMEDPYYQMRMRFNGTKGMDLTVEAVKYDGITMTSVELWTGHVSNGSQVAYWNWTPIEILEGHSDLDSEKSDEVWIRIVLEGETGTNLTTGDEIDFQFAFGGPGNSYSLSSWGLFNFLGIGGGIVYGFFALLATPLLDIRGGGHIGKVGKTVSKTAKNVRKGKRRKKGVRA